MHLIHSLRSYLILLILIPMIPAACKGPLYLKSIPQEDRTLYFVSPVEFKSSQGNSTLEPDFTYNHQPGLDNSVVMNFSLYSKSPVAEIQSIALRSGRHEFNHDSAERMFMEKSTRKWHGRFSTEIPRQIFLDLLGTREPLLIYLHTESRHFEFISPGKWQKKVVEQVYPVLRAEINS